MFSGLCENTFLSLKEGYRPVYFQLKIIGPGQKGVSWPVSFPYLERVGEEVRNSEAVSVSHPTGSRC